jgi:hypothetical protein
MNKPVIAPPASGGTASPKCPAAGPLGPLSAGYAATIAGAVVRLDDTDRAPDEARRRYEHSWVDSTRSLDGGRYIRG